MEKEFKCLVFGQKSQRFVVLVIEKDGLVLVKVIVVQLIFLFKKLFFQLFILELLFFIRFSVFSVKSVRLLFEFFVFGGGRGVYWVLLRDLFYVGNLVVLEFCFCLYKEMNELIKMVFCVGFFLWVVFDYGLKVWDIEDVFSGGSEGSNNLLGDEDVVVYIFLVVNLGVIMCLVMDNVNQIIWFGYRDGRLRVWLLNICDGGF